MTQRTVPVIDMALGNGHPHRKQPIIGRRGFVSELGLACEGIGFATVVNHGIPHSLIRHAYATSRKLFRFSDVVLSRYETPQNGRQTGFASFKTEHAKDQEEGDLKRFYHIRRELPLNHSRRRSPAFVPNIWPQEVPEFYPVMTELFGRLEELAVKLLVSLDEFLGFPEGTLPEMTRDGETLLRMIQYPSVRKGDRGIRSAPHEDINLITLLPAATDSGLEVKTRAGRFIPVREVPESIVVNVGDMLQLLTKHHRHRLISTTHRVRNPPSGVRRARYSGPCFIHPRDDVVLDQETGFTAGAYLRQRLQEIGLYGGAAATDAGTEQHAAR